VITVIAIVSSITLTDIYLADVLATRAPSSASALPPHVSLSAEQLASKVGLYRDQLTETVGRIFLRDGKLMASPGTGEDPSVELTPVGANQFVASGTPIAVEFIPAAPGRPQQVHVTGAGPKPIVSQQLTTSFAPSSAELRAFGAEYTSAEVEGTYTLAPRNARSGDADSRESRYRPAAGLYGRLRGRDCRCREVLARRARGCHGIHSEFRRGPETALRSSETVNDASVGNRDDGSFLDREAAKTAYSLVYAARPFTMLEEAR
jgi:hypothetical protein